MIQNDAGLIIENALRDASPAAAVKKALEKIEFGAGRVRMVAIGKAGWDMGKAACEELGDRLEKGIIITKYGHSRGPIDRVEICEAGHPVPDLNSYAAGAKAIDLVRELEEEDSVLFLVSGGGSALFECPLLPPEEMEDITKQLLASGAPIQEINTIRKRISAVKGGKFALCCAPAHVYAIVLSDVIGDRLDVIASGPAYPDASTAEEALEIVRNRGLVLSDQALQLLKQETPKELDNVDTFITGSVKQLCRSAEESCLELGYEPVFLTACLDGEAREVGRLFGSIARDHQDTEKSLAYIAGGETVVHLTGRGLGGRNQEIALSAAEQIRGCRDTCIFSLGSDGTDGPTDAAGGIVDGDTAGKLDRAGISIVETLQKNDAYHSLKKVNGLIMTGPTGTNVNDLTVLLIKR